jgi:HMG (high mobility group) box
MASGSALMLQRLQQEQMVREHLLATEREHQRQQDLAQLLSVARGGTSLSESGGGVSQLLLQRLQQLRGEAMRSSNRAISPTTSAAASSSSLPASARATAHLKAAAAAAAAFKSTTSLGSASTASLTSSSNDTVGAWSITSAGILGRLAAEGHGSGMTAAIPATSITTSDIALLGKKKFQKKPKDQPTRALSAYNIFFKEERQRILNRLPGPNAAASAEGGDGGCTDSAHPMEAAVVVAEDRSQRKKNPHGKISFESLAKAIGRKWQSLSSEEVQYYKRKSEEDKERYKQEMDAYLSKKRSAAAAAAAAAQCPDAAAMDGDQEGLSSSEQSSVKRLRTEE